MSHKTPNLFDVPRTHPSRRDRVKAFKEQHGIETHHCRWMARSEYPWYACLMPAARKFGYGVTDQSDLGDIISKVGRLVEEANVAVLGQTEVEAIRELCRHNDIQCDL